jgi:hypothetical protein
MRTQARQTGPTVGVAAETCLAPVTKPSEGSAMPAAANCTPTDAQGPAAPLEPDLQAHIGQQLRAAFQEIVDEPVPDRFIALLERLSAKPDA